MHTTVGKAKQSRAQGRSSTDPKGHCGAPHLRARRGEAPRATTGAATGRCATGPHGRRGISLGPPRAAVARSATGTMVAAARLVVTATRLAAAGSTISPSILPPEMRNRTYLALVTFVDGRRRPPSRLGGRPLALSPDESAEKDLLQLIVEGGKIRPPHLSRGRGVGWS